MPWKTVAGRSAALVKIPQYPTKTPQENASKIMTILEKHALSPTSTRQKAQKYLQEKQAREERKILVDGVYRDPDDLDGSKEAAAARREQRKRTAWLIAGVLILVCAVVMCVLTAKGINPLDNLKIQSLSGFRFRF